ncbi:hypothetical protein [Neomegalonema sp.]|uniref:hypothetical protein n=1 Tax=Neomegalonema sp. TaxID=2039713 RepID=UPI00260DC801|nr:hypothetical protein [Neomegalonema sp.]MDD2869843.1 hypothetical protein [Neomegalonema sp.]
MNNPFSRPVLRGGVLALAALSMAAVSVDQAEARGRNDNAGAAIAAGVVGLAVGAMIGSASASSPTYYAAPPATPYYPTYSAPTYVAPTYAAPTYYPAPTYYAAPTYVQPAPVYVQPAPVYVAPPVYRAPTTSINIGVGGGWSSGPRWSPPRGHGGWGGGGRWDDRGHRGGGRWDGKGGWR